MDNNRLLPRKIDPESDPLSHSDQVYSIRQCLGPKEPQVGPINVMTFNSDWVVLIT